VRPQLRRFVKFLETGVDSDDADVTAFERKDAEGIAATLLNALRDGRADVGV
jgi:hypothetical protein